VPHSTRSAGRAPRTSSRPACRPSMP
jgi:hypothetical protein